MSSRTNLMTLRLISVFLVVLAASATAAGRTIYVDADAGGANNGSSWTYAYRYLQDALAVASSGDEIRVAEGIYKPDEDTAHPNGTGNRSATFQLQNGVTIKGGYAGFGEPDYNARDIDAYETILSGDLNGDDGPNFTNNSENSYNIVTSSGIDETTILDGFTITGGNANGLYPYNCGGGIFNSSSSAKLIDCIFHANSAKRRGGGMYNRDGSNPTLTNCVFSNNSAREHGGGMFNSESDPMLSNCTFIDNSTNGHGGAIRNYSSDITLSDCTFSGNSATGNGGGMYSDISCPALTNCMFNGNLAGNKGGAMHNDNSVCGHSSYMLLVNCVFRDNLAKHGGGIYNYNSRFTLVNCMFGGNSADDNGGGIYNYVYSSPIFTNCTFTGNSAIGTGGTMYNSWYSRPILTNCILWDGGDKIWNNDDSAITITYSDVQGGWPGERNIDADPLFVDAVNGDYHLLPGSPCIDAGNNAALPADGTDLDGDGDTEEPTPLDLDSKPRFVDDLDTTDTGNGTLPIVDMGTYEWCHPIERTLTVSSTVGGSVTTPGEGSFRYEAEQVVSIIAEAELNYFFLKWMGTAVDAGKVANSTAGSTIVTMDGDYTLVAKFARSTIILYVDANVPGPTYDGTSWATAYEYLQDGLAATTSGYEIRVAQGVYKPDRGAVVTPGDRKAEFELKNGVSVKGGYAGFGEPDPNVRDIELYETILSGDLNGDDGPDFANNGENSYHVVLSSNCDPNAVLDGVTITGGIAKYHCGGGMYNFNSSPTVTNCTFIGNSALWGGVGGGMYNFDSSPTVTDCTFNENSADWAGGGIFNEGNSSPTLTNCNFTGNSASYGVGCGGGMSSWGNNSPTLVNCTFSGNSALWGGGVDNGIGSVTLTNCTFRNNSAVFGWGGGMESWDGSATLTNCAFYDNSADYGGGIRNYNSSMTVVNCTFTANTARLNGGGMYNNESSRLTLTNCILWNGGDEIHNYGGSTVTITYTDVQGGWPGEGNIDADPCFVMPGYWDPNGTPEDADDDLWFEGDYHLLLDSPCINTGDPNYIVDPNETDLDGRPRVIGGKIDMGAYEFNHIPVADAGPDQTVYTWIDGIAEVTLDGTGSYDEDGQLLTYEWSCTIDDEIITTITATGGDGIVNMLDFVVLLKQWLRTGNSLADIAPLGGDGLVDILDLSILTQAWLTTPASLNWNPQCDIAPTGATPTIELPCGVYSIELIVNDGIVDSEPDYVEITVLDGTPPVITCPSDVTLECPADTSTAATGSATATDNCDDSPAIVYSDLISGTCPMVIERTWTVTDASGNSSSCVQVITVQDTTPPVITGLPDLTLECPADTSPSATGQATATDACGSVTITHSDVSVSGCENTEIITRTWTATDECGNSSTCIQTITVVDTTQPEIEVTVPPVDAALQDGVTLTAEASDLCGDVTEVYFYVREPGGTNGVPIGYEDLPGTLNTTSGKWEYAFDTTQLQDGYYIILAKAIDTCGNEGWSVVMPFSIRNWAVIELLPASESNKAGRTMPVKFSLRIAKSVDPVMPFVYNEGLEIRIYDAADQTNILQASVYGEGSRDYRIDSAGELYITNFKTKRQPAEYVVQIWRTSKNFLVGSFTFETVK